MHTERKGVGEGGGGGEGKKERKKKKGCLGASTSMS